ncbi:hypothetical protein ACFL3P_01420 [Pseudomonadota bacterium]
MQRLLILSVLLAYSSLCFSYDWIPERRKDQNPTQPAHLIVPLPYSKPGIGDGFVLMGTVSNVAETTADITGLFVTGDADGSIINGSEVPLFSDILFLDFYLQNINRAAISNYSIRGISNTSADDFTILDISVADEINLEFNLTFYQRRLNFYYSYRDFEYQVDAIRDHDGALITTLGEPFTNADKSDSFRASVDLTDDYLDPRKGLRFDVTYQDHKANNINEPDFYTLNYKILGYLPMGKIDTLVLNYFQSDAHVQRQGNTDPDSIRAELDMNCAPADAQCLAAEQELVDNFINARTHGTSSALGGDLRLRSFPQQRYQGAHTAFIGAEYRWNITQEVTPFDYFIWKDVRTGLQVAFFAEIGTVSETSSQLWDETRHSIGAGFRLVAASGAVYRADIATGKEGAELIVIFDYPWE